MHYRNRSASVAELLATLDVSPDQKEGRRRDRRTFDETPQKKTVQGFETWQRSRLSLCKPLLVFFLFSFSSWHVFRD
jgi:hypothetical protein